MSETFNNIEEAIFGIPYYEIPTEYKAVYHYLKKQENKNHDIPEECDDEIEYVKTRIDIILEEMKEHFRNESNFRVLQTGKIIYTQKESIYGYICPNCGYDYDGNAQCNCYDYIY